MSGKNKWVWAQVAAALGVVVLMSTPAMVAAESYVQEIDQRKTNIERIRAQIEEAKALSDYAQLKYKIAQEEELLAKQGESAPTFSAVENTQQKVPAQQADEKDEDKDKETQIKLSTAPPPALVAIFGTKGKLFASVKYASGLIQDVSAGDYLDHDFRVKSISNSRLVLTRGDKDYVLRVYGGSNQSAKR